MDIEQKSQTEKWRILQLTSSSDIGGTERMLLNFLRNADRDSFDFSVYSLMGGGYLTNECKKIGINARTFGIKSFFNFYRIRDLVKEVRNGKFHLIHSYGLRADLISRVFLKKWDKYYPILVSGIRSIDPHRRFLHIFLDRLTAKNVSLFISNSEAGRQVRIKREKFSPEKIVTIYNGVSEEIKYPPEKRMEIRRKLGLTDDIMLIGHISNLRRMKGHEEVLLAAKHLIKENPKIFFIFAGRDDSGGKIPELAKELNIENNVKFLGFYSEPEEILRAIDVFILPSYWEGFPASILEAMIYSLPVIASNVGGIPEIIQDGLNGILIPPKKPDALSDAIKRIINDRILSEKLSINAYKTVTEKFQLSKMVNDIQNTYKNILKF